MKRPGGGLERVPSAWSPSSFVFQVTAKFAIMFITVQYNVTQVHGELLFLRPPPADLELGTLGASRATQVRLWCVS